MMMMSMEADKENNHVKSSSAPGVLDETIMKSATGDRIEFQTSPTGENSTTTDANESTAQVGDGNKDNDDDEATLDIVINNVVCTFNVRCHLDLRKIALNGVNVEYKREHGMVIMKMRKPYATASLWPSGKITCTGATSEDLSKVAARRFARILQKLGFRTRFANYRVVNVLGTCTMPFAIHIIEFSKDNRSNASYEPELHPGVTYRIKDPKATVKIFSTGSITVTAPSVHNVQAAVEHIFPIVYKYKKERLAVPPPNLPFKKRDESDGGSSPQIINNHRHHKARFDSRRWRPTSTATHKRAIKRRCIAAAAAPDSYEMNSDLEDFNRSPDDDSGSDQSS